MGKSRPLSRAAAAILALEAGIGVWLVSLVLSQFTVHAGSDFAVYYAAARALRLAPSANIYQWPVIQAGMSPVGSCWLIPSPFVYPPLLAILLEPFTLLPCVVTFQVWDVANAVFLSGALYLVSRIWPLSLGTFALFSAATLLSFPLLMGLFFGQIHILVLFGLTLALWRYTKGDQIGTGIAMAFVAWIQVIPGLFAVYFLLRRDWRMLISMLGTGALILIGMLVLLGPQWLLHYLQSIGHTYAINQMSLNASLVYRLGLWVAVVPLLIYVSVLWRWRGDWVAGFFWTIATMILVSPIAWPYFLLWFLPICLFWWLHDTRQLRLLTIAVYCALFFSKEFIAVQAAITIAVWLVLGWEYLRSATMPSVPLIQPLVQAGGLAGEIEAASLAQPASDLAGG